jgi:polyferredoxin
MRRWNDLEEIIAWRRARWRVMPLWRRVVIGMAWLVIAAFVLGAVVTAFIELAR